MTHICPICGKAFDGHAAKVYCSRECKQAADTARKRKSQMEKVCPVCGKTFTASGNLTYCSEECRSIARKNPKATRKCPVCGAEFNPHGAQRFCSEECRSIAMPGYVPEERECVVCGAKFFPRDNRNITCSPECSYVHRKEKALEYDRARRAAGFGYKKHPPRKKKKESTMEQLARIAKEAIAAGLSYGEYVRRMEHESAAG